MEVISYVVLRHSPYQVDSYECYNKDLPNLKTVTIQNHSLNKLKSFTLNSTLLDHSLKTELPELQSITLGEQSLQMVEGLILESIELAHSNQRFT